MRGWIVPMLLLAGGLGLPGRGLAQEPPPPSAGGETIDVEIKVIPFYAVDATGEPVYDLRREEVELRVDGKAVAIDSFDSYAKTAPDPGVQTARAAAPPPPPERRHVMLFFDVTFSSPPGLNASRRVAADLLHGLPANDTLYLLTNDPATGFAQKLGPLRADASGREQVLREVRALKPAVRRLNTNPDGEFAMGRLGMGSRNGAPNDQMSAALDSARANGRSEYEAFARHLADSLQTLATELRRIPEPKLLVVFSQGFENGIYFRGNSVGLQTGNQSVNTLGMQSIQFPPLMNQFQAPLQALADSGTMAMFVNLDAAASQSRLQSDAPLRHMAETAGGLYIEGRDSSQVGSRVSGATSAYYEAGFYLAGDATAVRGRVDVRSLRPGVRLWAPASLKTRETWRGLDAGRRKTLIVDLVEGGIEAQRARSQVRLDIRELPGSVLGSQDGGRRRLRYEAAWPRELAGKEVDLYNVLLVPTPKRPGAPEILQFEQRERTSSYASGAIEIAMPAKPRFVWGIVAVERGTGRTWFRRLMLQGEAASPGGMR